MDSTEERQLGDQRLSRLEAVVEGLSADVDRIARSVGELTRTVSNRQQTPWATMAAWAAVIISVMALAGSGYVRDMGRQEQKLMSVGGSIQEHFQGEGHPQTIAGVMNNKGAIVGLDVTLQREMRLLDDRQVGSLLSLDARLQTEMRLLNQSQNVEVGELARRIAVTEGWTVDHDKRVIGLNAAQWERIKALERKVFGFLTAGGPGVQPD